MALTQGDAALGTGLAGAIKTEIDATLAAEFGGDYDSAEAESALIALGDGIAKAVIDHLKANMDLKLDGVTSGVDSVTVSAPNAVE